MLILNFCSFYVLLFHERTLLVFKNYFQTDALVRLLPLIGSSTIRYFNTFLYASILHLLNWKTSGHSFPADFFLILPLIEFGVLDNPVDNCPLSCSTAWLVGVTGVLAPLLEETLFRGFLMVSLTKWYGFFLIIKHYRSICHCTI